MRGKLSAICSDQTVTGLRAYAKAFGRSLGITAGAAILEWWETRGARRLEAKVGGQWQPAGTEQYVCTCITKKGTGKEELTITNPLILTILHTYAEKVVGEPVELTANAILYEWFIARGAHRIEQVLGGQWQPAGTDHEICFCERDKNEDAKLAQAMTEKVAGSAASA